MNHHRSEKRATARDPNKPYTWTKAERDLYIMRGFRPKFDMVATQ